MSYFDQNNNKFNSDMARFLKTIGYLFVLFLVVVLIFIVLGCFRISSYAFNTYESVNAIPHNKVGLLLGTSPLDKKGTPNDYFTYRIMAASQLYKAGKIDYVLVSGDNRHESYNEPRFMSRALIKYGVPQNRIVFDFAGISTLDSVIRARKVFLQNKITIISQGFHNERALFIADNNDIEAIGYNAINPNQDNWYLSKVSIREFFARVKAVFDVYILKSQPKFLGSPENIGSGSLPKELTNRPKKLTSAIKQLTDNTQIVIKEALIAKYEPVAKRLSDAAVILNARQENQYTPDLYTPERNDDKDLDYQQNVLLSDEQKDAIEQSKEIAQESLNQSNSDTTYLDPQEPQSSDMIIEDNPQPTPVKKQRKVRRRDIKTFNGDPWDYY